MKNDRFEQALATYYDQDPGFEFNPDLVDLARTISETSLPQPTIGSNGENLTLYFSGYCGMPRVVFSKHFEPYFSRLINGQREKITLDFTNDRSWMVVGHLLIMQGELSKGGGNVN